MKETLVPRGSTSTRLLQNQDSQLQYFITSRDCPTIITGFRGGQILKINLQSVVFQRLFRQEETPLLSTKCLNMSETSL